MLSRGKGKLTPIGQGDIGGQIGRDLKLIDCHIAVIPPAAYNAPGWGIVDGFCPVQRFVVRRCNRQCAVRVPDAAHTAEQPAADGTVAVMVQGFVRLAVFVNARPGFPNGRGTLADLIQPAGGVGLQKQLVGSVRIAVFCQHIAQKWRGQKACVQVVVVLGNHPVQRFGGGFAFFLTQQWQFWVLAVLVGMFQGGVQALSRSHFAKIIPAEKSGEYFGLFDICGKGASFLGTMIVSVGSQLTGSANVGIGMLALLFAVARR